MQATPFAFFVQMVFVQTYPATQSVLVAHLVRQAVVPQIYGLQGTCVPAWQLPAVPQRPATVPTPAVQLSAPQTVPEAYFRQAPAPSQVPSPPHIIEPPSVHCMSGS